MNTRNQRIRTILGISFYILGILIGAALNVSMVWADLEASFYGFTRYGQERLKDLHCPVFFTSKEEGKITATFYNPTDHDIDPRVWTDISSPGPFESNREAILVEPGKSVTLEWQISTNHVVLERFVFFRIFQSADYGIVSHEATCGIMFLDIPFLTGEQLFWLAFILCILGIIIGAGLWESSNTPLKGHTRDLARALRFMAILILAGMFVAYQGNWVVGILFIEANLLMVGGVFFYLIYK